jgi:membrane protein DedA with SNARE-associated domain
MEDFYANLLGDYGPLAVFLLLLLTGVGVPLGEDLIIIPAGILVGSAALDPWLTAAAAYAGVLISDCMWYALCSVYGTRLLQSRWFKRTLHPRRLLEFKHHVERRGAWVVLMARFIPGSRTPAITAAGVLHLPFWKFVLATAAGCLVTVPLQLGLGYLIAEGIGTMGTADLVRAILGVVVLILAILLGLAWWRQHRAERKKRPRAKAAWLRRFRPPALRRGKREP